MAASAISTRAGGVTERRHCLVRLLAWLRVPHHPHRVARLRSERLWRHTSGDEWGLFIHPPTPPALMYWSCLIPVTASAWAARTTGGAFIMLTCHMTPLSGFNVYHFVPDQLSRF